MKAALKILRDYLLVMFLAGSLALLVRFFLIEAYRVPSDFMSPALLQGELIFVNKIAYGFRFPTSGQSSTKLSVPRRGDVVVFSLYSDPSKEYLKRVVGVPGDKIQVLNNALLLNGKSVSVESGVGIHEEELDGTKYRVIWDGKTTVPETTVPENNLFVLGDNRSKGQDSRHWGFLPMAGLKGKALLVWFTPEKSRLFKKVN